MFAVGISRAKQGTLDIVNHVGAKALAEIGLVGTAPAIASAVFHEPPSVSGTCRSHRMSSWPDRSAGSSMREFLLGSGRDSGTKNAVLSPIRARPASDTESSTMTTVTCRGGTSDAQEHD